MRRAHQIVLAPARQQGLDDDRIQHRAAARDHMDRAQQLIDVRDVFLEQVAAPGGAAVEQSGRVRRFGVVGQRDHAGAPAVVGGQHPQHAVPDQHRVLGHHDRDRCTTHLSQDPPAVAAVHGYRATRSRRTRCPACPAGVQAPR
nr:hypothetical protein [Nocardia tengchongensis]